MSIRQKVFICPICGTTMDSLNCKITCHACGYREDCSDAALIIYEEDQPLAEETAPYHGEKRSAATDQDRPFSR